MLSFGFSTRHGQQVEAAESSSIDVLILRALRNFTGLVKSLDTRRANPIRPGWLHARIQNGYEFVMNEAHHPSARGTLTPVLLRARCRRMQRALGWCKLHQFSASYGSSLPLMTFVLLTLPFGSDTKMFWLIGRPVMAL